MIPVNFPKHLEQVALNLSHSVTEFSKNKSEVSTNLCNTEALKRVAWSTNGVPPHQFLNLGCS